MGNTFGYIPETGFKHYFHPEVNPGPLEEPTFDPQLGFERPRKQRVMIATQAEMESAKIAIKDRDYCAHKLIAFRGCRRDNYPWVVKCQHEKHEYLDCKHEDMILRMKEFERERRLRVREQKMISA